MTPKIVILKPYKKKERQYMKVKKQVRSFYKSIDHNWEKAFTPRNKNDIRPDGINDLGRVWTF